MSEIQVLGTYNISIRHYSKEQDILGVRYFIDFEKKDYIIIFQNDSKQSSVYLFDYCAIKIMDIETSIH